MPRWDFGFWLILTMGGTLLCLSRCHRQFKWARLIEGMPTSRIRSASQGYTELIGVAELQGNPQLAPLSNTLHLWWRYTEHLIMEGDPLYTLRHFETDSGGLRTLTPKQLIVNVLNK